MMTFIDQHFTVLMAAASILALLALLIVVELFRDFKQDAIKNGDQTPTVTAVRLTLSTIKNFLMLRKAVKGEVTSRPRSTNPQLSGTISVPRDEIGKDA